MPAVLSRNMTAPLFVGSVGRDVADYGTDDGQHTAAGRWSALKYESRSAVGWAQEVVHYEGPNKHQAGRSAVTYLPFYYGR